MSSLELTLGLCSVIQAEIWELVLHVKFVVFTIASQHYAFVLFGYLLFAFFVFRAFALLLCLFFAFPFAFLLPAS